MENILEETRFIMKKYNIRANKNLGQNFLINEEVVKTEKFLHIIAPAIAYPYVRAFISNVLLVSNLDPAILPVINFQKLFENNIKSIS